MAQKQQGKRKGAPRKTEKRTTQAPPPPAAGRAESTALLAGAVLLILAASAYGVLEVHFSNDTWIGLAAGRLIEESPEFPIEDTYSYTFAGSTWFNQNWLSHVGLYQLYQLAGPNGLVIVTWLFAASIFLLVLLAIRLRCGGWLISTVAASVVAVACRDWLSIRPATVQFFLLAALWLALSALAVGKTRWRWWAVALAAVVLLVWPHAHGSFVFGFGLVAMYLFFTVGAVLLKSRRLTSDRQTWALVLILVLATISSVVLSPYGLDNLLHPSKVAGSEVFRQVSEWQPPTKLKSFPPVGRFWTLVSIAALLVVTSFVAGSRRRRRDPLPNSQPGERLGLALFDVAAILLGLAMALWARRFAPILYILATPALMAFVVPRLLPGPGTARLSVRRLRLVAVWAAALAIAVTAATKAHQDLVENVKFERGGENLLARVTQMDRMPLHAVDFLEHNDLRMDVFTEWKVAGPLMFLVPGARVFIDGRSQQVYTAEHYKLYMALLRAQNSAQVITTLDRFGTELVLLPSWSATRRVRKALTESNSWLTVFSAPRGVILARAGSDSLGLIGRRMRKDELWWPDLAEAEASQGLILVYTAPQDVAGALTLWTSAVNRKISLGPGYYPQIVNSALHLGRLDEASAYILDQRTRIQALGSGLPSGTRKRLLESLARCDQMVMARRSTQSRPVSPGEQESASPRPRSPESRADAG